MKLKDIFGQPEADSVTAETRITQPKTFSKFLLEDVSDDDFDEIYEARYEGKISELSPERHKLVRQNEAEAAEWHAKNPVHHDNIIKHYNQATAEEHHNGHTWYSDAHHMAKVISKDTNTPMHIVAGLISNYSPQTQWHTNIMTASKVAREKRALGGKGSGVFADERQKAAAHRLLNGEHYNQVIKGQKTHAFAHLIEHGGNKEPDKPHVVVDRHAYSVAAGSRITDAAFGQTKLKTKKGYGAVADAYHKAAKHLSEQHGVAIHPHQVQATTWLVRQRLNSDEEHQAGLKRNTKKANNTQKTKWDSYAKEHHPALVGKVPGTGYD